MSNKERIYFLYGLKLQMIIKDDYKIEFSYEIHEEEL
jgi:hypothetical protein